MLTNNETDMCCKDCGIRVHSYDKIHYRADDYCLTCAVKYIPELQCGCCNELKVHFTKLSDLRAKTLIDSKKLAHTAVCKECFEQRIYWNSRLQQYELKKAVLNPTKPVEEQKEMNNAMSMDRLMGGALGPDTSGKFKASMMGIAIKNSEGVYCIYDGEQMVDVMDFIMPGFGDVFKMPASVVEVGDLILHQGEAHYVREVNEDKTIEVLNPFTSKVERLMPTKNLLGFKFFVKIVSMSDMFGFGKMDLNSDNPFGNMGQMMMMSMMFGGGDGKNNPMAMFGGGSDATNPFGGMMGMMMMSQMFGGKDQENPLSSIFGGLGLTPQAKKTATRAQGKNNKSKEKAATTTESIEQS